MGMPRKPRPVPSGSAAVRPLEIRLLGELQVTWGDGVPLALPASRKTRALLGYLIATGQPHRRERLCDLLWDGPDDPRAELRWSLSKLRPLLDGVGARLVADRERAGIELAGAEVDLLTVRVLLGGGLSDVSVATLKQAASLFRGEFLDGLDLPACYRFQEWCMAEREAVSRLRLGVLAALVERLQDRPAEALDYARALAVADPLSEAGHAAVVRLLGRTGRRREALGHYERARKTLEAELGAAPSGELRHARRALDSVVAETGAAVDPAAATSVAPEPPVPGGSHSVGRGAQRAAIEKSVVAAARRHSADVLLVTGDAGIGKSHMLGHLVEAMRCAGGQAWTGRAFEAEAARPYGVWLDVLRAITRMRPNAPLPIELAVLLPEAGAAPELGDRTRLFDAVAEFVRQVASDGPVAIAFDDIQWIDEASASLLHYVVRRLDAASGVLLACTARPGEIDDNAAASSVLRSLSRERRLRRIELAPLGTDDTIELVRLVDPALDGRRIFSESEGNPLFALELARAYLRGDDAPGPTIGNVIAGQLALLSDQARDVLLWAAATGRAFAPDDLARAARLDAAELLPVLGELERRGLVRPSGADAYDFTHDLVRQAAYSSVSQPRRKLLHRQIARALDHAVARDGGLAADLVRHASLADEDELAARACVVAGERALRLFANAEAANFADRGLRHVERLADGAAVDVHAALLRLRILAAAGPGMRPLPPLVDRVAAVAGAAERLGVHAAAATCHYLLSVLHQEAGDTRGAQTSTLRAAAAGRGADEATRARQLANTARCLLELETEIGRSRHLIREGSAIVDPIGLELCELHWARGLLHRWDGQIDLAAEALMRALALARRDEDRWREYKCLTWLAVLAQEQGRYAEMETRCAELRAVAARIGEDEAPFVATLQALAALAAGRPSAEGVLADALARLRMVDDKSDLAYALNSAARIHLRAGRIDRVRRYAAEALQAASAMRRNNEAAIAQAMLARTDGTALGLGGLVPSGPDPDSLSARARAALVELGAVERHSNGGSHAGEPL